MPTLPLLQTPSNPDAWHQVRAPGGYEGWYFDAHDFSTGLRLTGSIGAGCRFEGLYKSSYQRYQKHPTKNPPPIPEDFPILEFAILKQDQLAAAARSQDASPLIASTDRLAIQLPSNQLTSDGDSFRLQLKTDNAAAQLLFTPVHSPAQRFSITPKALAEKHHWNAVPFCQVTGTISQAGAQTPFNGMGCLEHRLGTLPVPLALRRGIVGRVLSSDRALIFHAFETQGTPPRQQAELIELSTTSAKTLATAASIHWPRLSNAPRTLAFDQHLSITHPRLLQAARSIMYEVFPNGASTAICTKLH
jgi:carotenoid 1,2-hydratase